MGINVLILDHYSTNSQCNLRILFFWSRINILTYWNFQYTNIFYIARISNGDLSFHKLVDSIVKIVHLYFSRLLAVEFVGHVWNYLGKEKNINRMLCWHWIEDGCISRAIGHRTSQIELELASQTLASIIKEWLVWSLIGWSRLARILHQQLVHHLSPPLYSLL